MLTSAKSEEINNFQLSELPAVAKKIITFAEGVKVWTFEGEMGAGKTTLIKSICQALNVLDTVSSPTFSLVNEYQSAEKNTFYHFDFYRLKDETEALDIGVEEYLYSGNYCFIEWPSKIESLLPSELIHIQLSIKDNSRSVKLFKNRTFNN